MATIEPAGASTQVFQAPAPRAETQAQQEAVTERPVEETEQTAASDNQTSNDTSENREGPGAIIDTVA